MIGTPLPVDDFFRNRREPFDGFWVREECANDDRFGRGSVRILVADEYSVVVEHVLIDCDAFMALFDYYFGGCVVWVDPVGA